MRANVRPESPGIFTLPNLRRRRKQEHLSIGVVRERGYLRRVMKPDCRRCCRRPQAACFAEANLGGLIIRQTESDDRAFELNQRIGAAAGSQCALDHQPRFLELAKLLVREGQVVK